MSNPFRGVKSGELDKINSKTKFNGGTVAGGTKTAVIVHPGDASKPREAILSIAGTVKRVYCYRIYIMESVGHSETGTAMYPMPGSEAEKDYLSDISDKETREYRRKQLLISSTKVGYYERSQDSGELPVYGSEVYATPIQEGLLSEAYMIKPTGLRHGLDYGLGPISFEHHPNPNFSDLEGNEALFDDEGKPASLQMGEGSIKPLSDNVNYECLHPELKKAIESLISEGGYNLVVTSAYRTTLDARRTGSSTLSNHNRGLAVDFEVRGTIYGEQNSSGTWVLTEEGKAFVAHAESFNLKMTEPLDHGTGPHFHFKLMGFDQQDPKPEKCTDDYLNQFYTSEERGS